MPSGPGHEDRFDVEDTVPDKVALALEVQASLTSDIPIVDRDNNVWMDGSRDRILRLRSDREGHRQIYLPGSAGLGWVVETLERELE